MDEVMEETKPEQTELPSDASETVYIKNLNETVKLDVLRQTLRHLFSLYGQVLDVKAHGNVRMRGQAFIAFAEKEPAVRAVKEVTGFPLYGKPMQCSFARTRSDANILEQGGKDALKTHKQQRLEHKRVQRTKWRQRLTALRAGENEGQSGDVGNAATVAAANTSSTATARSQRQDVQLPDEYLPPNKILFLHNVPASVQREELETLFREAHSAGLTDVRLIGGRNVAFVEYQDAMQSSRARDQLNGHELQGEKLRITFARG